MTEDKLIVTFVFEDFEPALRKAGIDPDSITEYEWSKFTDAFCDGTHWDEVAETAADCLLLRRATADVFADVAAEIRNDAT